MRLATLVWLVSAVLLPATAPLPAVSAREALRLELTDLALWLERADHHTSGPPTPFSLPLPLQPFESISAGSRGGCLMISRMELLDLKQRLSKDLSTVESEQRSGGRRPGWQRRYGSQLVAAAQNLSHCQQSG